MDSSSKAGFDAAMASTPSTSAAAPTKPKTPKQRKPTLPTLHEQWASIRQQTFKITPVAHCVQGGHTLSALELHETVLSPQCICAVCREKKNVDIIVHNGEYHIFLPSKSSSKAKVPAVAVAADSKEAVVAPVPTTPIAKLPIKVSILSVYGCVRSIARYIQQGSFNNDEKQDEASQIHRANWMTAIEFQPQLYWNAQYLFGGWKPACHMALSMTYPELWKKLCENKDLFQPKFSHPRPAGQTEAKVKSDEKNPSAAVETKPTSHSKKRARKEISKTTAEEPTTKEEKKEEVVTTTAPKKEKKATTLTVKKTPKKPTAATESTSAAVDTEMKA